MKLFFFAAAYVYFYYFIFSKIELVLLQKLQHG